MMVKNLYAAIDSFTARPLWVRAMVALVAGAVMALGMAPMAWWFVLIPCLSVFYIALSAARRNRDATITGWAFGFGFFVFGLYWIGNALLVPGNDFKWAWPLAVVGLPIGLAFFTSLSAWIAWRFSDMKHIRGFFFFCAAIMLGEYARGHILTGFPWNLYAYTWAETPAMAQGVALFGPYGLSALTLFWAASLGAILVARPGRVKAALLCAIVLFSAGTLYAWGAARLHATPTQYAGNAPVIRLIQPNIPQENKWNPQKIIVNLGKLISGLSANPPVFDRAIIAVWPETAITTHHLEIPGVREAISSSLHDMGVDATLMTGMMIVDTHDDGATRYANSLVAFDNNLNTLARFDKAHLVPFGEYMPMQSMIPVGPLAHYDGFTPGPGPQTLSISSLLGPIPAFSPMVCYEIIFPGAVVRSSPPTPTSTPPSPPRAEWIVNVTNDGWYGNSPGPYQHLAQTMFRAIEEGVPVVRAANNGISVIIDPVGRILVALPYDSYGVRDSLLPAPLQFPPIYGQIRDLLFIILIISWGIMGFKNKRFI